jgi:hypothetical protein
MLTEIVRPVLRSIPNGRRVRICAASEGGLRPVLRSVEDWAGGACRLVYSPRVFCGWRRSANKLRTF